MAAVTRVALTKLVVRAARFHSTVAPDTKLPPSAVRVKPAPPAVVDAGVSVASVGGAEPPVTVNVRALVTELSGLRSVTGMAPAVAMSALEILALTPPALRNVVGRGAPFHSTVAPSRKSPPSTTSVKAGPPAAALDGLRAISVGALGPPMLVQLTCATASPPRS